MPYTPPSRSVSKNSSNSVLTPTKKNTTGSAAATPNSSTNDSGCASNDEIGGGSDSGAGVISKLEANSTGTHSRASSVSSLRQSAFHNFMNHQNDSFHNLSSNSRSKFYLLDNNSDSCNSLENTGSESKAASMSDIIPIQHSDSLPARNPIAHPALHMTILPSKAASSPSIPTKDCNVQLPTNASLEDDLMKFTTESTLSYSYTPVSINSLTMRLNVLKRSLEILLENPDWLNTSLESFPDYNIHIDNPNSLANANLDGSKFKDYLRIEKNVSSSTLQTLIQSAISAENSNSIINNSSNSKASLAAPLSTSVDSVKSNLTDSLAITPIHPPFANANTRSNSVSSTTSTTSISLNTMIMKDLHEILKLLDSFEKHGLELSSDLKDKVLNLHNLSLFNSTDDNSRKNILKIKILHALATPFIEQNSTQTLAGLPIMKSSNSTLGLSGMSNANIPNLEPAKSIINNSSRQFHASSNAKTKSPKAVFTVSTESPWDLLNANDLGLLMFGFSKSSLRKMKLLDLIAPRSRDLVINRLYRNTPLVFSGEIIAVKRDNKSLAWTSVWAKRKSNLIILIFEQVVCETIDMVIERRNSLSSNFIIGDVSKQNKSLYEKDLNATKLSSILPSLASVLKNTSEGFFKDEDITSSHDSTTINKIRYFTFKREDGNFVPCAITSESLDIAGANEENNDLRSLVRLNLHSLPYIAGSIVISSKNYRIESFNEAIAKNLFGTADLKNQSIDIILPDFTNLIKLALRENPNLNYQEGLVLPEHYFRKLYSWSQCSTEEEKELMFLRCAGIRGCHNDGNTITVDIQLHVANTNMYVIWITFGRSYSTKANDTTTPTATITAPLITDSHTGVSETNHSNDDSMDSNGIPSQLKLLDTHYHLDTDSQGSNSTNMSRSSSAHTINQSGSLSPSTPKANKLKSLTKIAQASSSMSSNSSEHSPVNHSTILSPDSVKPVTFAMSSQMTCAEHLLQEEEELAYLKKNSPYFPKVIGAEKRVKKYSDFRILKNLGQGAYGKVVFAQYKKDHLYKDCLKAIFKERILVDTWVRDRQLGTVPSEIQILYALNKHPHANIMRIVDYFEDDNCYYLETLQHGSQGSGAVDLYDIIEVKKDMTEYEAKYIYFQVVAALTHMHSRGIVHRDIKDENIIVDKDYFVKLIDFGSAAWVKDGPFGVFVGTIDYAAPEVLNGQPYEGKSQDVWAMGILLYTLIFKENPFCSVDEILDGEVKFPQYSDVSPACLELIRKILVTDISKRPTMQDIMNDPWLYGFS